MTSGNSPADLNSTLADIQLIIFDFDGVFTNNVVYVTQDGTESVQCWRSDGLGISRLLKYQVKLVILSTEKNPVVTARANKLNLPCRQGVDDKRKGVLEICKEYDIDSKFVAFVGNDINDISAFGEVGLPIAVADAYPEVFPYVLLRTSKPGGYGAVREVCDLVYLAKVEQEKISRD